MSDGKDLLKEHDEHLHEDERSPLAPEDDHSGPDFDIADEVEAKLGAADAIVLSEPAASPAPSGPDANRGGDGPGAEDDLLSYVHDDEHSPLEHEDDHSSADFDIAEEVEAKLGAADEVALSTPAASPASSGPPSGADDEDDLYHIHDDDRSPLAPEDDHSSTDFDIAEEVEAKLGAAGEITLSEPAAPPPAPDNEDDLHHIHDDDRSPLEHEDDHSGADFVPDNQPDNLQDNLQDNPLDSPLDGLDTGHVHPGLAAALGASYAYAQGGMQDGAADGSGAEPGGESPDDAADDSVDDSVDAEACTPLDPEDSGEDNDALPDALLCADGPEEDASKAVITKEAAIAAAAAEAAEAVRPDADDEEDDNDDEDEDEDDEEDDGAEDGEDKPMTLRDHLTELRKRLFRAFMWIILGFMICYPFAEQLFTVLFQPLMKAMPEASKLIYTSPPEAFFTFMKVAFVGGIFCTSPLVFYQIWAFIAPGLYKEEKMYILPVAFFSAFFFISGGAFCYFVVFPFAFEFFMSYNQGLIQAMPALNETLSFVLQLLLAFGLVFELPLFVFFLARLGIVTADMMRKFRRYSVLIMVILAAILTPPDVLSQLLMAGPLILLYEASILIAAAFGKKKEAPREEEEDDEEDDDEDEEEDATPRTATQQEQTQ